MRKLPLALLAAALLAAASLVGPSSLSAADLDDDYLRGPEYDAPVAVSGVDWSGVYLGVQAGYTTTSFNFGSAGQSDIAHILRNTAIEAQFTVSTWNKLQSRRGHDASFGGFAGYNVQFDDVVLGIEADYTSVNQKAYSADGLGRFATTSAGYFNDTYVATSARATLQDYGTVRARAGYAFGQVLPFVTGGLAYGRGLVGSTVFVASTDYTDATRTNVIGSIAKSAGGPLYGGALKEKFTLGGALGAGFDVSITQNVFLRAEYQYVWFNPFGDYKMNVNTVRGAVGVKF